MSDEYINKQSVIEFFDTLFDDTPIEFTSQMLSLRRYIRTMPSIKIVHCKDCKHAHMTYNGQCKYCDIWFPDEEGYTDNDYFCADGELK